MMDGERDLATDGAESALKAKILILLDGLGNERSRGSFVSHGERGLASGCGASSHCL